MRVDLFVHFPESSVLYQKLDAILAAVRGTKDAVSILEEKMAGELDALTAKVEENTSVDQSAIVLLNGLKQKLDEAIASGDPTKLQALSDALGASNAALAAAVAANTPAEPPA